MKKIILLLSLLGLAHAQEKLGSAKDKDLYRLARTNLKSFAETVSRDAGSELGKSKLVVKWLAEHFEWKATDYQKRTVQEIVDRGGGNCNELAMVAVECFRQLNIRMRRVREVNIHKETPERGETAQRMVREKGNRMSVFGRRHNDHVWLEIHDSKSDEWNPADPSIGVVGTEEWLRARAGFGKRYTLDPISVDMIVPFAIIAANDTGGFTISRTKHYMVEGFNRLYQGKLEKLSVWKDWVELLDKLDLKANEAFRGETNLHEYEHEIGRLADVYAELSLAFVPR